MKFGLSAYDARHLVDHRATADFFEACMEVAGKDAAKLAKSVANLAINDVTAWLNASEDADLAQSPLTPARAVELVKLLAEDAISSKQAKQVFSAIMDEDKDPSVIVEERRYEAGVGHPAPSRPLWMPSSRRTPTRFRYKEGNTKVIGFFVGQCMKRCAARAIRRSSTSCWRRSWQNSAIAACGLRLATCGLCKRKLVGCEGAVCGRVRQPTQTKSQT